MKLNFLTETGHHKSFTPSFRFALAVPSLLLMLFIELKLMI